MARKKIEPINSLGSDIDNLTVQKSRPLFALWRSELTLPEFKILDTYLSRIDSHHPEKRTVRFEKGELESLLGVKRIRSEELDSRLKNLMTSVKIDDPTSRRGFRRVALFEYACADADDDGVWQVEMTCTQSAMRYIFDIEQIGYLRYKLRCIINLKSRYSYVLFTYLESNRFRKEWDIDLDELKHILNCDQEETYKEYKRFNDLVLKKVNKELNERTECHFSYTPVKRSRKVVAIHFTLESVAAIPDQIPGQMAISDILPGPGRDLWESAVPNSGFTAEQIEHLRSLISTVPETKMPDMGEGIDINRYHYVWNLWTKMLSQRRPIRDRYAYLCRMIEQDVIGS